MVQKSPPTISRVSFLDLFGPIAGATNPITWHFYGELIEYLFGHQDQGSQHFKKTKFPDFSLIFPW